VQKPTRCLQLTFEGFDLSLLLNFALVNATIPGEKNDNNALQNLTQGVNPNHFVIGKR
jgi:hypothetical protein